MDLLGDIDVFGDVLDHLYDGVYVVDRDRRIVYWNRGAERITGYGAGEVRGFRCMDNILMHVDQCGSSLCLGRCPLQATMDDGRFRNAEVYLHHKSGHRVPVLVRTVPVRGGNGAVGGAVEIFTDNTQKETLHRRIGELKKMALADPLTSLANRRYVETILESRYIQRRGVHGIVGLLFMDVDDFKRVNDTHGHGTGDRVLKMVASTMSANIRPFDVAGRWGGEEFVVLLKDIVIGEIRVVAERLRVLIAHSSLESGGAAIRVTVSVGATFVKPGDDLEGLVNRADELTYQSKRAGKNRVSYDPEIPAPAEAT